MACFFRCYPHAHLSMTKGYTLQTVLKYCLYNYKECHHDKLPVTPLHQTKEMFFRHVIL
jgi:hypothetical protein